MHCMHRGKGEAVLFIHGMPTNSALWTGVIDRLSAQYRCFAVDLPGMGKTPFQPYSSDYLDRVADRIDSLRVRYKLACWHVVGHDAGSAVAAHYASRFPKCVGCLALLSPAIFPDLKPFVLLNQLRTPIMGEALAPLLHLLFWKVAMRRALDAAGTDTSFKAFYGPFSGFKGPWQLMRLVRWGRPAEMLGVLPAELAALEMPTLLFQGSRDVLPPHFSERAAALIKNSRLVKLDSGHFLPIDRPNDVASSLHSFFREHRASPIKNERRSRVKRRSQMTRVFSDFETGSRISRQ